MLEIYVVVIVCPYGSTKVVDLPAGCAAEAEAMVSGDYPDDYEVFAHFECYRMEVVERGPAPVAELAVV